MFNAVIKWSLANRTLVIAMSLVLAAYGTWVVIALPIDIFPDLNRPTVTILTEATSLAPEEVETLVTFPIETLMNGLPGVERVRSQSGIGLSIVTVEFGWNTDIYRSRQLVAEKLDLAKEQLPENVVPTMAPVSSIMGEIMLISVRSRTGKLSPLELRSIADWTIRPRILTIGGIAQVINIGGGVKQYQVLVSPNTLKHFGITIEQVADAVAKAGTNSSGGFVDFQSKEYLIRNIARFSSIEELKNTTVVYRNGTAIKLSDIAKVEITAKLKRGEGSANGKPAVIMAISKQPGTDTLELTQKIDAAIDDILKTLPEDIEINARLFRQANFIQAAIDNVIAALRDGALLVVIVLFLFLMNLRTTLITLTAIPVSFFITFIIFKWFDITINTMTLGGLAVAIGELVDDSIVDVENIFRRLRENKHSANPRPSLTVVYEASCEIRSSIVYATLIVVLVFVPLFALPGIEGRLLIPLGISYMVSLIASLLVSLTLTPVLASYLLPQASAIAKKESLVVRLLKRYDERLLRWTLSNTGKIIASATVLLICALAVLPFLGTEFLPHFNEGTLTISLFAEPGTSLAESDKIGATAEKLLLKIPEVVATGRRTGRAEQDEHAEGVNYSEIDVDLRPSERSRAEVIADIRKVLSFIPASVNVGQPISHRIDHLTSGIRAQIAIKLFGDDLEVLRAKAEEIRKIVASVAGTTDVQVEKQALVPQLRFEIDRQEAARYGLQAGEIAATLETALNGRKMNEAIERQRRYDVYVRYDMTRSIDALKSITIDSPSGTQLPVTAVAKVAEKPAPNQILRENGRRRIVIMANVQGRDLGSVAKEIKQDLSDFPLPEGYFIEYGGQFEAQQQATARLIAMAAVSIAVILLLLIRALGDWRTALQVLINIPLALIGAVAAMLLTDGVISIATLVGLISLIGITCRNGIMMLSHYLHLMKEEGEDFDEKMIIRGSLERLIPVLMTALTAGLSLVPLALSAGQPGREILHPLAVVVLGGIITATLLDQLVTPAVFYRYGRPIAEKLKAAQRKYENRADK
ncbi:MAG: efflux RND transporter permease subunit [Acidobacteriota bacterium]|nr:efflux RND transporter permease subunit [Blastocatellia bacterium]MDW8411323.1 efflux RND transporter permease subunit [Acidobacteriota bacterium]